MEYNSSLVHFAARYSDYPYTRWKNVGTSTDMKNRFQLLVFAIDGENEDEAAERAYAQLAQLPEIKVMWEAIEKMNHNDYTYLVELNKFYEEFSYFWSLSSPKTIDCFGEKLCYDIFELFYKWKECVWSADALIYYEQLPEELTVYRGGAGSIQQILAGHSWTLNQGLATNYSKQSHGIVISARLAKTDVLYLCPAEAEIVLRRESLSNVELNR